MVADQEASDLERAAATGDGDAGGRDPSRQRRPGPRPPGRAKAVSSYLGYDVARAGGAAARLLEAVRDERLPAGPWSRSPAGRQAAAAVDVHRRAVAALGSSPSWCRARYSTATRSAATWAARARSGRPGPCRPGPPGGRWPPSTDPFAASRDRARPSPVRQRPDGRGDADARAPAGSLLAGDGAGARLVVRYLATLRSHRRPGRPSRPRSARVASALVRVTSATVTAATCPVPKEAAVARAADDVLAGLAGLWALDRAAGGSAHAGVGRRVATGAGVRGIAPAGGRGGVAPRRPTSLSGGGAAASGSSPAMGRLGWTDPEVIGDRILSTSARTARRRGRFRIRPGGGAIDPPAPSRSLANDVSSPSVSGGCSWPRPTPDGPLDGRRRRGPEGPGRPCCPSSSACSPAGRSPSPLWPRRGRPVRTGAARRPRPAPSAASSTTSSTRPTAPARVRPAVPSRAWPGWGERQVPDVLARLVADDVVATELVQAARAARAERLAGVDLLGPVGVEAVRAESFVVGAADGLLGDRVLARTLADGDRFDAMVAGADLVVNAAGLIVPAAGGAGLALRAWGPGLRGRRRGRAAQPQRRSCCCHRSPRRRPRPSSLGRRPRKGWPTPSSRAPSPRSPWTRPRARGLLAGLPPPPTLGIEPVPVAAALAAATRPGDNANRRPSATSPRSSVGGRPRMEPIAGTIAGLEDAVGRPAQGRRWVASDAPRRPNGTPTAVARAPETEAGPHTSAVGGDGVCYGMVNELVHVDGNRDTRSSSLH